MTSKMTRILFLLLFLLFKGTGTSLKQCNNDSDCGLNMYCYISKYCANFTNCNLYNRNEGITRARDINECGTCLQGYIKKGSSCHKNTNYTNTQISVQDDHNTMITLITVCVMILIVIFVIIVLICKYIQRRKKYFTRSVEIANITEKTDMIKTIDSFNTINNENATTSEENKSLIECVKENSSNNNKQINEERQNATVYQPPQWESRNRSNTQITPYSENNNVNVSNERNYVAQVHNSTINSQSTVRVIIGLLPSTYPNVNSEDDARNKTLEEAHTSFSDSNPFEFNNIDNENKKNVSINQLLNQNIQMGVNVLSV